MKIKEYSNEGMAKGKEKNKRIDIKKKLDEFFKLIISYKKN
tara:strand:+ start:898 stop:1020 length:123 start_codon:yes stop_codon:yes gene_type:complete